MKIDSRRVKVNLSRFDTEVGRSLHRPRGIRCSCPVSLGLILEEDGIDYSVHETTLEAGQRLQFQIWQAPGDGYCVSGAGTIEDVAAGRVVNLEPGVLYSVGIGDDHVATT